MVVIRVLAVHSLLTAVHSRQPRQGHARIPLSYGIASAGMGRAQRQNRDPQQDLQMLDNPCSPKSCLALQQDNVLRGSLRSRL